MPVPIPDNESRSKRQLLEQYRVERELSQRLLQASKESRQHLYGEVYDELVQRVPYAVQATEQSPDVSRNPMLALQVQLLQRFLTADTTFLDIGSGEGLLPLVLAPHVRRVIAVEASASRNTGLDRPDNFELLVKDMPPYPIESGSVDLSWSCHFIEHLHPDDAADHAEEMHRILAPGGRYVVITPNRLLGPWDVSKYFADEPRGLHLKEYSHAELAALLKSAGFDQVQTLEGAGQSVHRGSLMRVVTFETMLGVFSVGARRRIIAHLGRWQSLSPPIRPLEQVKLVAVK